MNDWQVAGRTDGGLNGGFVGDLSPLGCIPKGSFASQSRLLKAQSDAIDSRRQIGAVVSVPTHLLRSRRGTYMGNRTIGEGSG